MRLTRLFMPLRGPPTCATSAKRGRCMISSVQRAKNPRASNAQQQEVEESPTGPLLHCVICQAAGKRPPAWRIFALTSTRGSCDGRSRSLRGHWPTGFLEPGCQATAFSTICECMGNVIQVSNVLISRARSLLNRSSQWLKPRGVLLLQLWW